MYSIWVWRRCGVIMTVWVQAWKNHYLRQGDKEVVDVGFKEPLPEVGRQWSCGCWPQGTITWGRETMKVWMLFSRNHYLRQGDNEGVDVVLKEPLPEAGRQRSCGCWLQGTITWGRGDNEVVDVVLKEPLPEAGRQWSCQCWREGTITWGRETKKLWMLASRNHYLR